MSVTIDKIVKHPEVSKRITGPRPSTRAIDLLIRLRFAIRDGKRTARNMAEEVAEYGTPADAYDRGMAMAVPSRPGNRLLLAALGSNGLPEELRVLIVGYLGHTPTAAEIQAAIEQTVRREARHARR